MGKHTCAFLQGKHGCRTYQAANEDGYVSLLLLVYYSMIHFLMAKPYTCRWDKNKHITQVKTPNILTTSVKTFQLFPCAKNQIWGKDGDIMMYKCLCVKT